MPILPQRKEWPIVVLSKQQDKFIAQVIQAAIRRIREGAVSLEALIDELETALYKERLRIRQMPWAVDPPDEEKFWRNIKNRLVDISANQLTSQQQQQEAEQILLDIVSRYTHEIASKFRSSHYQLARRIVTFGFSRLLNAARVKGFRSLFSTKYKLSDKINIVGEVEHLRRLAGKGTVVMVPTHFSNLDSILIGWVIHELGLPPFIYGAGLNLFNIDVFAYFMNSLGAYKVDRRKKNKIYIETLKAYSGQALQWGTHSLFFPGGTRSRSGSIEDKLKLGLLGTAMEAQRISYQRSEQTGEPAQKIFIVPVVINYHFVLEAPSLINDYLSSEGQERYYIDSGQTTTSYRILKFLIKFFTKGSDISVSFGCGMDLLGNYVDDEGHSLNKYGQPVSMREYFCSGTKITYDKQREEEYTRMLGEKILHAFYKNNQVFSSHLVAFVAFEIFRNRYQTMDIYNFLRLPEEDQCIPYEKFRQICKVIRDAVFLLKSGGRIHTAKHLEKDLNEVIQHGLDNVGMYHAKRPLLRNKAGDIVTMDMSLLFYYHNRLEGYNLSKVVKHHLEKLTQTHV